MCLPRGIHLSLADNDVEPEGGGEEGSEASCYEEGHYDLVDGYLLGVVCMFRRTFDKL